jgi:hypothetical protein
MTLQSHADVYQHLSLSTVLEKDPDLRQDDIDKSLLFSVSQINQ